VHFNRCLIIVSRDVEEAMSEVLSYCELGSNQLPTVSQWEVKWV